MDDWIESIKSHHMYSLFTCLMAAFGVQLVCVCCYKYDIPNIDRGMDRAFRSMCMARMFSAMHLLMVGLCGGMCVAVIWVKPNFADVVRILGGYVGTFVTLWMEQAVFSMDWKKDLDDEACKEAVSCKEEASEVFKPLLSSTEPV